MSHTLPIFRFLACLCLVVGVAVLFASFGRKPQENKENGEELSSVVTTEAPAPTPESSPTPTPAPAPASTSAPAADSSSQSSPSRPEQAGASPAGLEEADASPAGPEEADQEMEAHRRRLGELSAVRVRASRAVALADAALDSRTRALNEENVAVQAALETVRQREADLAAAESALKNARDTLEKAYATDEVWADFKAKSDAAHKQAAEGQARIQHEIARAHQKGIHLTPRSRPAPAPADPEAAPAPADSGAVPAPADSEAAPAPTPDFPSSSTPSRPEQAGASPAGLE